MTLTCADVDFDLKLAEFKINGYAVFEDMIPGKKIDRIREAFLPLLAHIQERETEVSNVELGDPRIGQGRLQTTNRYTLTIPWIEPFADPAIYEHPVILEFLDRFWRPDSYVITCYHSNTPCAESVFQHWHRDTGIAREIPHVGLETVPVVGVKFPLVETSEENGSFEVLPSTQYIADPELRRPLRRDPPQRSLSLGPPPQPQKGINVGPGRAHPPPRHAQPHPRPAPRARRLLLPRLVRYRAKHRDAAGFLRVALRQRSTIAEALPEGRVGLIPARHRSVCVFKLLQNVHPHPLAPRLHHSSEQGPRLSVANGRIVDARTRR